MQERERSVCGVMKARPRGRWKEGSIDVVYSARSYNYCRCLHKFWNESISYRIKPTWHYPTAQKVSSIRGTLSSGLYSKAPHRNPVLGQHIVMHTRANNLAIMHSSATL